MVWARVCLSVCLSVTIRYSVDVAEWIELVLGIETTLALSCKGIQVSSVIGVLPSGMLSQSLILASFSAFVTVACHDHCMCCQLSSTVSCLLH